MLFNGQNKKIIDPRYFLMEQQAREDVKQLQQNINKWYQTSSKNNTGQKSLPASRLAKDGADGIFGDKTSGAIDDILRIEKVPGTRNQYNVGQLNAILQNVIAGKNPTEGLPASTQPTNAGSAAPTANAVPAGKGIIISTGGNSNNYAIVYGGTPSNQWGAATLSGRLKEKLRGKNVIFSDFENSIDSLIAAANKQLGKNVNITLLFGWSRGGKNVLEGMMTHPQINYFAGADPSSSSKLSSSQIDPSKSIISLSTGKNGGYALRAEAQFKEVKAPIFYTGTGSHWETVPKLIDRIIDKFPS